MNSLFIEIKLYHSSIQIRKKRTSLSELLEATIKIIDETKKMALGR